jgi:hypothetical protein
MRVHYVRAGALGGLRIDRLTLAPYSRADEDDFVRLFADERVSCWMGDVPLAERGTSDGPPRRNGRSTGGPTPHR